MRWGREEGQSVSVVWARGPHILTDTWRFPLPITTPIHTLFLFPSPKQHPLRLVFYCPKVSLLCLLHPRAQKEYLFICISLMRFLSVILRIWRYKINVLYIKESKKSHGSKKLKWVWKIRYQVERSKLILSFVNEWKKRKVDKIKENHVDEIFYCVNIYAGLLQYNTWGGSYIIMEVTVRLNMGLLILCRVYGHVHTWKSKFFI